MKFTLTIELGNDAMSDYTDLSEVLRRTAGVFRQREETTVYVGDTGKLWDINGNTVGKWEVS